MIQYVGGNIKHSLYVAYYTNIILQSRSEYKSIYMLHFQHEKSVNIGRLGLTAILKHIVKKHGFQGLCCY